MNPKIQNQHTAKPAYVYLRQSTISQVRHHPESTERQYALKDKAAELGWPESRIRILDGDLGLSGTPMAGREDFQILVADVSMSKVGAVFALEASRLARSCTDWHRLLELCALTGTLIIDEDGSYDPADFNHQLLLGLKGTMFQAELHFLRARLQGGKLNKAKKGELRRPLPVGLCYDDESRTVLDPDDEVRGAVQFLFDAFRQTGSAYAAVHRFGDAGMKFPKRAYGGVWDGQLIWGRLGHTRVLAVLKNPAYAGAYVHGRYRYVREIGPDGSIRSRMILTPMPSWQVLIRDHHLGYEEVDPANRLVAASLERRWNDSLVHAAQLKEEYAQRQSAENAILTPEQKERIRQLARDHPRLWKAPTTRARDRKRILRLMIQDITVEKLSDPKQVVLHLRWQGGACEDIPIRLPPRSGDQRRHPPDVVDEVRRLAVTLPDADIAATLNGQGKRSALGKPFSESMIKWIRYRHEIPAAQLKHPGEWTVKQTAEKFGVSPNVVYYWITRGVITGRRINQGSPWWLTVDAQRERELLEWVRGSSRIQANRTQDSQRQL